MDSGAGKERGAHRWLWQVTQGAQEERIHNNVPAEIRKQLQYQ